LGKLAKTPVMTMATLLTNPPNEIEIDGLPLSLVPIVKFANSTTC